jgi:hypothetical protein
MTESNPSDHARMLEEVYAILKQQPDKMYSKEEILNRLEGLGNDREIELILGELEVGSSANEAGAEVYAKCRGGTVYYRWNKN